MIKSVYYFSPSLKKTANKIINGLKKSRIVVLVGEDGSGKTSLCRYMIETKLFEEISPNVKYVSFNSQELDDTDENYLLIVDSLDNFHPGDNCAISKLVNLSALNKILLVSRSIDTATLPSFELVSMPKFTNSEVLSMISLIAKRDGIKLTEAQVNQISKLSNGSFLNAKLITTLMQESTLAKIFEDMRTVSDINFDSKTWSTLSILIGKNLENQGDLLRAKEYYCHAYNCLPKSCEKLKFELLSNLGDISAKLNAYADAISYYKQALNYSKEIKEIALIYNNIGSVLQSTKNFVEAEAYFQKALCILEDLPSCDKSVIQLEIVILTNLGACYRQTQNYENAIHTYERALSYKDSDINSLVAVYHNMATTYVATGEYDHALSLYKKALEIINRSEATTTYDLDKLKHEISKNIDFCMQNL